LKANQSNDSLDFLNFNADTLEIVKSNFHTINYFLNSIEKKIFNINPDELKSIVNLVYKKIYGLILVQDFQEAIRNLQKIKYIFKYYNKSDIYYYNISLLYYNDNYPQNALIMLDSVRTNDSSLIFKINVLKALCYNELYKFKESKSILYKNKDFFSDTLKKNSYKHVIDSLYQTFNVKSLKKARIFSFLFPGSGYLYLKKFDYFLTSFILFSVSGFYIYFNLLYQCYIATGTVGLFLLKTSYFSGINGLENVYKNKHLKKIYQMNSDITKIVFKYE
jgi:tetratricopeptide (TPR) repeat protein